MSGASAFKHLLRPLPASRVRSFPVSNYKLIISGLPGNIVVRGKEREREREREGLAD